MNEREKLSDVKRFTFTGFMIPKTNFRFTLAKDVHIEKPATLQILVKETIHIKAARLPKSKEKEETLILT